MAGSWDIIVDVLTSVNPADALKDLEEIRALSTIQFRDLVQDPGLDEPMLEDLMEPSEDPPVVASGDGRDG